MNQYMNGMTKRLTSVPTVIVAIIAMLFIATGANAQEIRLTLGDAITMAADSSLSAVKAKRSYQSGYWEYRAYKAARLPSLTLNLTPAQYNRNIVQRYDSENDRDVFRTQQSYYASGGFSIVQNVDLTGGTLYLNSSLDFLRSFGDDAYSQFSSVPFNNLQQRTQMLPDTSGAASACHTGNGDGFALHRGATFPVIGN